MTTLRARTPADLLAAVPVMLGFVPVASLVMLGLSDASGCHARLDLPPPGRLRAQAKTIARTLEQPCRTNGLSRVACVLYTSDAEGAAALAAALCRRLRRIGVDVAVVARADGGRCCWVPLRPGDREGPSMPYDEGSHEFVARAVLDGRVVRGSREELRATLDPLPEEVAAVAGLVPAGAAGAADTGWLVAWVIGRLGDPGGEGGDLGEPVLGPGEAARALWTLQRLEARDEMLYAIRPDTAARHLRLWGGLLRRAPAPLVAEVALVTAFAAWQSGDGALAWCALDRCLAVEPRHRFARLLSSGLTAAVPPSAWQEVIARRERGTGTA